MKFDISPTNWSRGQLETVSQCPGCGANKHGATIFKRRDNDEYMPDQWHMAQCGGCQTIWLDPRPDDQSLPRAYDDYYTHNTESNDTPHNGTKGLIWKLIHGYLNRAGPNCLDRVN